MFFPLPVSKWMGVSSAWMEKRGRNCVRAQKKFIIFANTSKIKREKTAIGKCIRKKRTRVICWHFMWRQNLANGLYAAKPHRIGRESEWMMKKMYHSCQYLHWLAVLLFNREEKYWMETTILWKYASTSVLYAPATEINADWRCIECRWKFPMHIEWMQWKLHSTLSADEIKRIHKKAILDTQIFADKVGTQKMADSAAAAENPKYLRAHVARVVYLTMNRIKRHVWQPKCRLAFHSRCKLVSISHLSPMPTTYAIRIDHFEMPILTFVKCFR